MNAARYFFIAAIFAPALGFAQRSPDESCGDRTHQLTAFEGYICRVNPDQSKNIHRVRIVDGESRKPVPTDPSNPVTQIAESIGPASNCRKDGGTLSLINYSGQMFLLGSAHAFYNDDGSRKCNKDPEVYLDFHYTNEDTPPAGHDPFKKYHVKMPPLNEKEAKQYANKALIPKGKLDITNLNDFVIFSVEANDPILKNQRGSKRKPFLISAAFSHNMESITSKNQSFVMANHANYRKSMMTAVEAGCTIKYSRHFNSQLTNCDAGGRSSGAPIFTIAQDGKPYVSGVIQGGMGPDLVTKDEFKKGTAGNLLVPIDHIRAQFEKYVGPETRQPETYYQAGSKLPQLEVFDPLPSPKAGMLVGVRENKKAWKDVQRVLQKEGFYDGAIDGLPGPQTYRGMYAYYEPLIADLWTNCAKATKRTRYGIVAGNYGQVVYQAMKAKLSTYQNAPLWTGEFQSLDGQSRLNGYGSTSIEMDGGDDQNHCVFVEQLFGDETMEFGLVRRPGSTVHTLLHVPLFDRWLLFEFQEDKTSISLVQYEDGTQTSKRVLANLPTGRKMDPNGLVVNE